MIKWLSCKDSEPDINIHVLLYDEAEKICVGYKSSFDGYNHHPLGDFATAAILYNVTHWMPLPEPPTNNQD